jgi:aspartate aminotransferase
VLEHLDRLPPDPILGLMAAYRADDDARKIDLGVGVYRDEQGNTPIMQAVRAAERAVLERQTTKTYVAPAGNPAFNDAMRHLALGAQGGLAESDRVCAVQAPGGCGALRLGAELIRAADPDATVYVSTPTWANHVPLLSGCGLRLERYPYYDPAVGGVAFEAMMRALETLPPRSVILLHASCHNPTGADLQAAQWRELLGLMQRRALLPFIDMAYQGLGAGVDEDAEGLRLLCAALPEALIAVSCSKNFGLYRERVGCLIALNQSAAAAGATLTQLTRIARGLYSMPPDHGAAIVAEILGHDTRRIAWRGELEGMRARIVQLRAATARALAEACPEEDFSHIQRQRGMFSYLGVSPQVVRRLREQRHVYMTEDGRVNVAGLRMENIPYFAAAVAAALRR